MEQSGKLFPPLVNVHVITLKSHSLCDTTTNSKSCLFLGIGIIFVLLDLITSMYDIVQKQWCLHFIRFLNNGPFPSLFNVVLQHIV